MKNLGHIGPVTWIKGGAYGALLGLLYFSALEWLVIKDWGREDFNYAFIIPFVLVYLIWEKREALASSPSTPSWAGLIPFGLGLGLFWLGELAGEFFTLYISFWLVVVGLCWLEWGWKKIRTLWFTFLMFLTMFPPPNFIYTKISFYLKLISSKLGVDMIRLYGMAAYREGNVIDLGFTQLQVVDACSGLRYLIPLIVLALLLSYFFKAALWKRVIVVVSAIPLSVFTNSLRIALTGILYQTLGPAVAEGFFHGFSGWFIFMFSLAALLLEMWLLGRIGKEKAGSDANPGFGPLPEHRQGTPRVTGRPFLRPQFMVAVILLGSSLVLAQGVEFREEIPISRPLGGFPSHIGEWRGDKQTMDTLFIDALDLSDYVILDYRNPAGEAVNLYVAYYESQRKGESIHSPATCLPGGGWEFKQAGKVLIPNVVPGEVSMPVNRAYLQKRDVRQLVYYWFPQRGRVLTNAYELKLYTFWDALTKQRTDGSLVRVITPVYPLEDFDRAEDRLRTFLREAVPVLREYLPGATLKPIVTASDTP